MMVVYYQINSLPEGVAKLVNGKFGWATWITLEAILLCKNCLLCASSENMPLQSWLSHAKTVMHIFYFTQKEPTLFG